MTARATPRLKQGQPAARVGKGREDKVRLARAIVPIAERSQRTIYRVVADTKKRPEGRYQMESVIS